MNNEREQSSQEPSPNRVWCSIGFTVNLGDYNSAKVDCGVALDIEEGESELEALKRARAIARKAANFEVDKITGRKPRRRRRRRSIEPAHDNSSIENAVDRFDDDVPF